VTIRIPASSANLGPGFDVLGLALSLYAHVGIVGTDETPHNAEEVDDTHPAQVAFVRAGGHGRVWVQNSIPIGRGLGFSGAVRVGGAVAAEVQQHGGVWNAATSNVLALCTELEGHADNVAASLHGGVVITSENNVMKVPTTLDPVFVMWVPDNATSTNESRGKIGSSVRLEDAVFNIAHTAMFVTALITGDIASLGEATRDRLHQDLRFGFVPDSRQALESGISAGAWCGWLSGSGPTVALMCSVETANDVAEALPPHGHVKKLVIDHAGAITL